MSGIHKKAPLRERRASTSAADLIERMGFGWAQWKVVIGGGGSKLADGAELLLLGSVTRAVAVEWHLDPWQKGIVVSVVFVGVLIGNLMGGVIGDKMGRRLPILVSYVGICLFSLLSVMATGFYSIACIRFCVGVSFGVSAPAFNTLCGEMAPSKYRVQLNAMGQLLFAAGEFYSAFLIWLQDPLMIDLNWRALICMGAIPSFVFLVLALCILPESPSFLMVSGSHREAKLVLADMRRSNSAVDVDIDAVALEWPEAPVQRRPSVSIQDKLGIVLGRHLLYSTLVTCVSVFTLNFLFYGGLYAFPQVLPDLKLRVTPSANLMLGALVEVPGFLAGIVIGNYLSRKNCMLVYLLSVIVFLCIFSFTSTSISGNFSAEFEALLQVGLIGSKLFTAVGFLIVYVYTTEIYPTIVRTMGGALCIAFGRFGSIVAPSVYENLAFATGSHAAFFHVTAGLCALNAILVLFLPYETKGQILQDHIEEAQPLSAKPIVCKMP
mmetsp:Transcript_4340/g.6689  ORF Transcript_4340/g.6689 Transcript_4340/m.6689 type:complete len:494 (+) Transcript_4340:86-1567(+)